MKLSILIPSKNEPLLKTTLADIQAHKELDTEVLWMEDPGIGQRATTNLLADKATGDYLMKLDAHCSLAQGFDRALLEEMDAQTILAPLLLPLDPPTWAINGKKQMAQFVFDTNLVMQHAEGSAGETMCLQGSCFVVAKDTYWKWNLGDLSMPSWGGQGVELGIKAFLNGGTCRTTDKTYYGHVFRHSDTDFPYNRGDNPGKIANQELVRRYKNASLAPLIRKFNLPADWTEQDVHLLTPASVV